MVTRSQIYRKHLSIHTRWRVCLAYLLYELCVYRYNSFDETCQNTIWHCFKVDAAVQRRESECPEQSVRLDELMYRENRRF